MEVLCPKQIA